MSCSGCNKRIGYQNSIPSNDHGVICPCAGNFDDSGRVHRTRNTGDVLRRGGTWSTVVQGCLWACVLFHLMFGRPHESPGSPGRLIIFWHNERVKFWVSGIFWRTHGRRGLKFGILVYPDHLLNWVDVSHGLSIYLILKQFWLCEAHKIWDFRAFSGEHMEGIAWSLTWWSHSHNETDALWPLPEPTRFDHDLLIFLILVHFVIVRVQFGASGHFLKGMEGMTWNLTWWCVMIIFPTD